MSGMMRENAYRAVIGVAMVNRDAASTEVTMCPCFMEDGGVIGPILLLHIASACE